MGNRERKGVLMNQDNELDAFKREIDLRQFAVTIGYEMDRRESWRGSTVLRRGPDKIIVKRKGNGHYVFFSVRDDSDHGTLIDFLQRRRNLSRRGVVRIRDQELRIHRLCRGRPEGLVGSRIPSRTTGGWSWPKVPLTLSPMPRCSRMRWTRPAMPAWVANQVRGRRAWSKRPSPGCRREPKSWRHSTPMRWGVRWWT